MRSRAARKPTPIPVGKRKSRSGVLVKQEVREVLGEEEIHQAFEELSREFIDLTSPSPERTSPQKSFFDQGPQVMMMAPTPPSGVTVRKKRGRGRSPEVVDAIPADAAKDEAIQEWYGEDSIESPRATRNKRRGSELQQRVTSLLLQDGVLTSPSSGKKRLRAEGSTSPSPNKGLAKSKTPPGSTPGKRRLYKQPRPSQLPDALGEHA